LGQLTELASSIENALSPENLTCDGEVRGQALKAKEKNLNAVALEIDALIEDEYLLFMWLTGWFGQ
jgi:hypothetical protein